MTKIGGGVSVFGIGGNAITDQGNTAPNKSIVLIGAPGICAIDPKMEFTEPERFVLYQVIDIGYIECHCKPSARRF